MRGLARSAGVMTLLPCSSCNIAREGVTVFRKMARLGLWPVNTLLRWWDRRAVSAYWRCNCGNSTFRIDFERLWRCSRCGAIVSLDTGRER